MTDYAEHLEKQLLAAREEIEELRKRVCVPEGYVVVPVEPTHAMRAPWKTLRGYSWHDKYKAMLAAAPAPVERNQCDGCQAGIQVESGMHRMGKPDGYPDLMACTAGRYGSAPVERVEQEAVAMLLIDDATAAESGDWDIEPIPAAIEKLARSGGAALPLYTIPQPAPAAALVIPDECPHMIVFDDADRQNEMFAGHGSRSAALRRFEQISVSWNAHLFVRIACNSRDDGRPSAKVAAQDVAGLVTALRTVVGMLHHKATTPLERESIKIAEAAIAAARSEV